MVELRSRPFAGAALNRVTRLGAAAAIVAFASSAANALEPLGNAGVSFRADVVVTADGQRYTGRLYHRPGMQRHEFKGQGVTRILRFDLNRMWTIHHKSRTYTEAALESLGAHAGVFDRRRLGSELERSVRVGKERIDRHLVRGMTTDRTQISGEAWMTRDGILYRLDLSMRFIGTRYDYRLALRNLRRMPVDQALFDVPIGYRQVSLAPRWLPPKNAGVADTRRGKSRGIGKMAPMAHPRGRHPNRPTATTSRAPKPPYSLEEIFKDKKTTTAK